VSGAAIQALGAAFCFALALILTQYGLSTVPSWRSPLCTIGGSMVLAWSAALIFVDWRSVDGRAADLRRCEPVVSILAAVGLLGIFVSVASVIFC
jgi:hypothetical protein